jgi:hypothetical protein
VEQGKKGEAIRKPGKVNQKRKILDLKKEKIS